eukprot:GHVS01035599.1.p1 GENE.GHVS01035599.1~~GHVS01035599.1.p1  ORF type:complete len:334 (-),score=41.28 GHVS01035599.1:280-1281(-)
MKTSPSNRAAGGGVWLCIVAVLLAATLVMPSQALSHALTTHHNTFARSDNIVHGITASEAGTPRSLAVPDGWTEGATGTSDDLTKEPTKETTETAGTEDVAGIADYTKVYAAKPTASYTEGDAAKPTVRWTEGATGTSDYTKVYAAKPTASYTEGDAAKPTVNYTKGYVAKPTARAKSLAAFKNDGVCVASFCNAGTSETAGYTNGYAAKPTASVSMTFAGFKSSAAVKNGAVCVASFCNSAVVHMEEGSAHVAVVRPNYWVVAINLLNFLVATGLGIGGLFVRTAFSNAEVADGLVYAAAALALVSLGAYSWTLIHMFPYLAGRWKKITKSD